MNSDDIAVGILKAATVIAIVAGITWLFYLERPWLAVLLGAVALVWPALWSQLQGGDVAASCRQVYRLHSWRDWASPGGAFTHT
jgi:hypothetical protein